MLFLKILLYLLVIIATLLLVFLSSSSSGAYSQHHETEKKISKISILVLIAGIVGIYFLREQYDDGEYCADIEYYNPNTETKSYYKLPVFVEDGKLVRIKWNNGGWLDSSHFKPPKITDGEASFTSDKDYEYEVKLLKKGSNCE